MDHPKPIPESPPKRLKPQSVRAWKLLCEQWDGGGRKPTLSAIALAAGVSQPAVSRIWRVYFRPHLKPDAVVRGRRCGTPHVNPKPPDYQRKPQSEPRERRPVDVSAPAADIPTKPTKVEEVAGRLRRRAAQWDDLQQQLINLESRRLSFIAAKLDEGTSLAEAARLAGPSFATAGNRVAWATGNCAKVAQELSGDGPAVLIVKEAAGLATKAEASEYDSPSTDD